MAFRNGSTHVTSDGFETCTGIRPTCRKNLTVGITGELVCPVVAMRIALIERQATTWALVVVALLCLIGRITISLYAFRRLQIADRFALLVFALLVSNGVCLHYYDNTMVLPRGLHCRRSPPWATLSPAQCLIALEIEQKIDSQRLLLPPCPHPCTNFLPSVLVENSQHQHSLSGDHTTSNANSRRQCFSGLACGASRHPFWRSHSSSRNA